MKFQTKKRLKRELKAARISIRLFRDEVERLKEAAAMPALYTEQDGKRTPLQQVRTKLFSEYEPLDVANQVHAASDILANDDEINEFALCLETSQGSFFYEIEDGDRTWEQNPNYFALKLEWNPIKVGKDMTILDIFIVHRDRIMRYVDMRGAALAGGDTLQINYTFDSSTGMRPCN